MPKIIRREGRTEYVQHALLSFYLIILYRRRRRVTKQHVLCTVLKSNDTVQEEGGILTVCTVIFILLYCTGREGE